MKKSYIFCLENHTELWIATAIASEHNRPKKKKIHNTKHIENIVTMYVSERRTKETKNCEK